MDPEESMAIEPSEEQGNLPVEAPSEQQPEEPVVAPEETPSEEQPAEPAAPPSEPALYELPDGRKVTGDELYKEHTQNLLPEFTRRSQKLSEYESGKAPTTPPDHSQPEKPNPYADPNYIPQTYEEIIAAAEERALARIEAREQSAIETRQAVETQVAAEIEAIKAIDPNVNTDQLFAHAVKYGFSDLKAAHSNMRDMAALVEKTQKTTAANVIKRTDPVSKTNQPSGTKPNPKAFNSAADYLEAVKASS